MSSIYEELGEACMQFGKNAGEAIKELNYLIATSNKKEREIMADKVPYSEIITRVRGDINYIAEEAYRDGYDHCEKEMREKVEGAYQRGLDDAWGAVKTLFKTFGTESACVIMKNDNVHGAIDRLKAYEEKQKVDDKIEVGDEVRQVYESGAETGVRCIVTAIDSDCMSGFSQDGRAIVCSSQVNRWWKKTGRHFDIEKILEEMRHD